MSILSFNITKNTQFVAYKALEFEIKTHWRYFSQRKYEISTIRKLQSTLHQHVQEISRGIRFLRHWIFTDEGLFKVPIPVKVQHC